MLFELLQKLHWTQSELARRSGITAPRISEFCRMVKSPTEDEKTKIQLAFGESGEYLDVIAAWPEGFEPLKKTLVVEQIKDVEIDAIAYREHVQMIAEHNEQTELRERSMMELTDTLNDKERIVIERRFGLNNLPTHTLEELGEMLGKSKQAVSQIQYRALDKLEQRISECDFTAVREKIHRFANVLRKGSFASQKQQDEEAIKAIKEQAKKQSEAGKQAWRTRLQNSIDEAEEYEREEYLEEQRLAEIRSQQSITKYGIIPYPNVVGIAIRRVKIADQIIKAALRNGFVKVSPGQYIRYDTAGNEITLRTCSHHLDPNVFFLLISKR